MGYGIVLVGTSRQAPTVSQLCDRYLEEHAKGRKKPTSLRNDAQIEARQSPKGGDFRCMTFGINS